MAKRLFLSLAALLVFFLLTEGALSLFWRRSWRTFFHERTFLEELTDPNVQTDADRFAAAARLPGPYRVHEDPRVAYVLKSDAELEIRGKEVTTDDLGMRARPGAPPPEDAFRILVLGDSVAFGWGLEEDEVIAVQLEEALREARGGAPPEVACFTVAVPSWNTMNAACFVQDHLDRLAPDLVLYMLVPNDLNTSNSVYETGHRREALDPFGPNLLVPVQSINGYLKAGARRLQQLGLPPDTADVGPDVRIAGLSATSRERLDVMAEILVKLEERLRSVGAPLVLVPYEQHDLHRQMRARLVQRGHDLPTIPLFGEFLQEYTQGDDPHPSAETARVMAIWIATSLLADGYLPPGDGALPAVDPELAGRRATELSPEEVVEWSRAFEEEVAAELEPRLEHESIRGMRQVYGGIHVDGSMGPGLSALLPPSERLLVELAPLPGRDDFYPQEIEVRVDGTPLGSIRLEAGGGRVARTFELPAGARSAPCEVTLLASDWCVVPVLSSSELASARFVALESLRD